MPALNQVDMWTAIQSEFDASKQKICKELPPPYVHPLSRRSSQLMSQKSLEICTENLGSETGSEFSSDESNYFSSDSESDEFEFSTLFNHHALNDNDYEVDNSVMESKPLTAVNYHGCGGSSGGRTFPPPLPSIARRDGRPCVRMQPHRQDGRLVLQAVPVRSNTYLHANRQEGHLRLCFIDCATRASATESTNKQQVLPVIEKEVGKQIEQDDEIGKVVTEEEEAGEIEEELEFEEEEEEEVEVVERRTVIEVKVGSTQNVRVRRSSLVINKFLGSTPDAVLATNATSTVPPVRPPSPSKRLAVATAATSAAAAVVAAASSSVTDKEMPYTSYGDTKLLFTTRRRDKVELLNSMRRCSELRRPLFIWEPCCIATS